MFHYRLGGLTLGSSIRFSELTCALSDNVDLIFQLGESKTSNGHEIHRVRLPNGEPWLSVERNDLGYCICFAGIATYFVSVDLKLVEWVAAPAVPRRTIRHLFLDQVFPMLMSGRGRFVLHASAVQLDGVAVGFIGPSGMGKSTLAAAFAQDGNPVLTDDSLILEHKSDCFAAYPTYASVRLWPPALHSLFGSAAPSVTVAHYTRKKRVQLKQRDQKSFAPLRALYILGNQHENTISICSVAPAEAFMELTRSTFRLDITNIQQLAHEFNFYGVLARSGFVRRLSYPRDLSRLPDVRNAVLHDLRLCRGLMF